MGGHDPLIDEKLSSKGWDDLRPAFQEIHRLLLGAAPSVSCKAETIYVKYRIVDDVFGSVFAVVWIRTQKALTAGLALPDSVQHPLLGPQPKGMRYPPLNRYFSIEPGQQVPPELAQWAQLAFAHVADIAARESEDEKWDHLG